MHTAIHTEYCADVFRRARVIYVQIHSVSRSGMSRTMSFYAVNEDGDLVRLNTLFQDTGFKASRRGVADGVIVRGCGMDMGFHAVWCVAQAMGIDTPRHEFL